MFDESVFVDGFIGKGAGTYDALKQIYPDMKLMANEQGYINYVNLKKPFITLEAGGFIINISKEGPLGLITIVLPNDDKIEMFNDGTTRFFKKDSDLANIIATPTNEIYYFDDETLSHVKNIPDLKRIEFTDKGRGFNISEMKELGISADDFASIDNSENKLSKFIMFVDKNIGLSSETTKGAKK